MITVDPNLLTVMIICIGAAASAVFYTVGSYMSPTARVAREEAAVWKGRYYQEVKRTNELEAAVAGDAPVGSLNGLEGLASMFLGGESFSIGKVLEALKSNPEMIGQLLQILQKGTVPKAGAKKPTLPDGTPIKNLG